MEQKATPVDKRIVPAFFMFSFFYAFNILFFYTSVALIEPDN